MSLCCVLVLMYLCCVLVCRFQVEDNVTVILLSEIVWDKFRPNTGCFEPLLLHFPDYSKGITLHTHTHTHTHTLINTPSPSVMNALPPRCIMMTNTLGGCSVRCEICTCEFVLTLEAETVEEYHIIKTPLYKCSTLGREIVLDM